MFSFLVGFLSSFYLPFSGFLFCVSFAVSFSRSLSLPPSTVSLSFFLTFLPLLCSLRLRVSFPPPFSSFLPLSLFLFFVTVVVSSSFSSRPSFSPSFLVFCSLSAPLVFPFLPPLSSSSFVSVSFPLPSSSLHVASSSLWSVLAASLMCSSSPLSPCLSFLFCV